MTYLFESLGDERFQQLCQAILVATHPGIQCLPVGQPDGGRDGFQRASSKIRTSEFTVYQVKYSKTPDSRSERDAIEQVIKTEKKKVEFLIERGATSYYLLTNVKGTSHLDVGSIDKVNEQLSNELGIPAYCWWFDDLERRIDGIPSIKWSYPEILRATDLLPALLEMHADTAAEKRGSAIKAYMAHQAQHDAQLKFKQIDLNKNIIELFVDVPARMLAIPGQSDREHASYWTQLIHASGIEFLDSNDRSDRAVGALQLLVNDNFSRKTTRLVVEGAPGQGKSTITQYLCQVNRLRLLNRHSDFSRVAAAHRPTTARIPFRVDLRDYASWLSGRDPFSEDQADKLPPGSTSSLESFIAAQINRQAGMSFSIDDLGVIVRSSQVLIVLDGFDEVAEIKLRNKIVAEVSDASVRLAENAISAQIIVTSRPAAFANSPGFPREEWQHLQILPLTPPVIELYARRWLDGRGAEVRERKAVLSVLEEKLAHPHVRDLARNPMQLAILLALISVQGASLPDKRTALYDEYITIFLNRESEKSRVVRDHRELLVQIHRYLAWILQSEAESSGAGNISDSRLREILRQYLETNCHPIDLVERLFTGMVERVVALVSRVQGTFEFEVQPLREYFAARHLYDTAPYKPAAVQNRAGKPERFDAIARNFYWLNVTRFYAGCYSSGELASLIDGIDEIGRANKFRLLGYSAQLGLVLLNDYVFSNHPRQASRLAENIVSDPGFLIYIAREQYARDADAIRLPPNVGSSLVKYLEGFVLGGGRRDVMRVGARLLSGNTELEYRLHFWRGARGCLADDEKWFDLGLHLGIFSQVHPSQGEGLIHELGSGAYLRFAMVERSDVLALVPDKLDVLMGQILSGKFYPIPFLLVQNGQSPFGSLTGKLASLLWPYFLMQVGRSKSKDILVETVVSNIFFGEDGLPKGGVPEELLTGWRYESVYRAAANVLCSSIDNLRNDYRDWSGLLEACRSTWGECPALFLAAIGYAEFGAGVEVESCDLFCNDVDICKRALYARSQASNITWWTRQLDHMDELGDAVRSFVMLCVVRWMPVRAIFERSLFLSNQVDRIDISYWPIIFGGDYMHRSSQGSATSPGIRRSDLPQTLCPRLASLLLARFSSKTPRMLIWNAFLKDYDGAEEQIWFSVTSLALEDAYARPRRWKDALAIIKRAYSSGHFHHLFERFDRHQRGGKRNSIPEEVAELVCGSPSDYPIGLVGAASAVLAERTGASAEVVAEVAARDGWFLDVS